MSNLTNVEKNVLEQYNLLFIHIPKNAGRTIVNHLVTHYNPVRAGTSIDGRDSRGNKAMSLFRLHRGGPAHQPASLIYQNDRYKHMDNFVFVRDPYERIASNFFWQRRPGKTLCSLRHRDRVPDSHAHLKKPWPPYTYSDLDFEDFEDFVKRLPSLQISNEFETINFGMLSHHFQSQSWWINDKTVFIGKMENLHEDLNALMDKFAMDRPRFSKQIPNPYAMRWNEAQQAQQIKDKYFKTLYNQEMVDIIDELYREDFEAFGYKFKK